jgi:hypothetical protein
MKQAKFTSDKEKAILKYLQRHPEINHYNSVNYTIRIKLQKFHQIARNRNLE